MRSKPCVVALIWASILVTLLLTGCASQGEAQPAVAPVRAAVREEVALNPPSDTEACAGKKASAEEIHLTSRTGSLSCGRQAQGTGPSPVPSPDLPPLEAWQQEEVREDYLEAWAWLYRGLQPDPSQAEYYFQDVSWQGENITHTCSIVQGVTEGLRKQQAMGVELFSQVPQRQMWVGDLCPSGEELKLVKVVDFCPQGRMVHKIDPQTRETIEEIQLPPYAEVVLMSYDDEDSRWKMGCLKRFELPADPEQRAGAYEEIMEGARNWD